MSALRRVSVNVPIARAEEARAVMLELFPDGFEEVEQAGMVELVAYTNAGGEERVLRTFGGASTADVEDGWHERWRRFHRPVRLGDLWIGPTWERPPAGCTAVFIDPGPAFGTGGHPSTRLSLELIRDLPRGSLLDVGSGSGILAVVAARLGFAPVAALDSDPVAVETTVANARANNVRVEAWVADATRQQLPTSDVAVANISVEAVAALAPRLAARSLVTSGYLASEAPLVPGYSRKERRSADGWAADLHIREE